MGTTVSGILPSTPTQPPLQVGGGRERREEEKNQEMLVYKLASSCCCETWGGTLGRLGWGLGDPPSALPPAVPGGLLPTMHWGQLRAGVQRREAPQGLPTLGAKSPRKEAAVGGGGKAAPLSPAGPLPTQRAYGSRPPAPSALIKGPPAPWGQCRGCSCMMADRVVHLAALILLGAAVCAAQPRGRILGGRDAEAHKRPYMASVQVGGKHVCGGFLVAAQWVLSAAHCLEDAAGGKVQVLLGAHSLSRNEASKRLYDVIRAVPHPESRPETIDHDLLLLQLSEKATLGPAVQLLPWQRQDRDVAAGTLCDVAGWGVVTHAGRRPDRLQYLQLPVLDRATCNLRIYHDGTITERMMCAQSTRRQDSCKGDSGGPLVCGGVAEGVVTSGPRVCGNPKKPGIYTRVASYAAWIDGVMAGDAAA
uniref:Complement factor D n=2 Tax=Equus TaxID=9789 RepID=A0A3Q2LBP6_HORSE